MSRFTHATLVFLLAAEAAHAQPAADAPADAPTADAGRASALEQPELGVDVSSFDQLRTTDSPAFVILGVSPTEIQRPSTPRGFVAVLGGFASEDGFAVPRDLALEVSPYWLASHPELSVTDYRGEHLLRPLRTFSLSVGTTQTERTEVGVDGAMAEHTDANIGIGFRTMLFQAGPLDDCTRAANDAGIALAQSLVLSEQERAQLAAQGQPGTPAYGAALEQLVKSKVDDKLLNDTCVALVASTSGFSVDLAGALEVRAEDSKLTGAATSIAGYSLWTDLAYDLPTLSLAGMTRLTRRNDEMGDHSMLDAGVRGIYKAKTVALSAEAVLRRRFLDGESTTYKVGVAVEYQINDDTWLSLTFSKGFAGPAEDTGSVFSLANIQWSIGKPKI